MTEQELKNKAMKYLEQQRKQREANKRWRMRNAGKVRDYHKRYNERKNDIIAEAKRRGLV